MRSATRNFYRNLWKAKLDRPQRLDDEVDLRQTATLAWLAGKGESVLDVGCGHGSLLLALRERYAMTVGFELEPLAASQAKPNCRGVVVGDIDESGLPFRNDIYQFITCLDVIEHVFDPIGLLAEIHRVLRPGGSLLLGTPNIRYWRHLHSLLVPGRFPHTSTDEAGYDGGHIHYFTTTDLFDSLLQVGRWKLESRGVFGEKSRRHRWITALLGATFEREFLAPGLLVKARKE